MTYRESGASWRPVWVAALALAVGIVIDIVLPGPDHVGAWLVAVPVVLGLVALTCIAGRRVWSVELSEEQLQVGQETMSLDSVDLEHLHALEDGGEVGGAETGARVLGGGWSIPKGRHALPLRRTDGTSVLVPTRDPESLRRALLARLDR